MYTIFFLYFLVFALGTVFGSFLNLVSDRVVSGEPIVWGRSKCDFCKKPLSPRNLIPLLSYLWQKGRSLCCKKQLSWTYPASELMTGIVFLFSAHYSKVFTEFSFINLIIFVYLLTVLSFFIVLFFTDAKYHLLPDKVVFSAIGITLLFLLIMTSIDLKSYYDKLASYDFGRYLIQAGFWSNHLMVVLKRTAILIASSFFISLFFWSLVLMTKGRGMGGGDVKLGFLIGLFNGFPNNILAVFLGFLIGSVYSLVLVSLKRKKMKDTIAFGPFLILGSFVAFIWGDVLINWYFSLI